MKKMTTLFKKDPNDLGRVINEVNPENEWVFEYGIATQKFDGTSCAIINGELYKRYDAKLNKKTNKRKPVPENAIPCQEPDPHGSWPHWVKCDRGNNADIYHFEAFDAVDALEDGTYELCGEKVQGNPENISGHILLRHGSIRLLEVPLDFDGLKDYLDQIDAEGIVFHHAIDNRKCKIRKSDFGLSRNKK